MTTSHATNGTSLAPNGNSQDLPRRLCFDFHIELNDIQGETIATSLGSDSILHDQLCEAWNTAIFTRRALNKMQEAARAMALRYPATDYATIHIDRNDAINATFEVIYIALGK